LYNCEDGCADNVRFGVPSAITGHRAMEEPQRILVIDDDEALQQSVRMILAGEGYLLEAAFGGESGLEKFGQFNPDIVLVDLRMPGLGGLDVLPKLKAMDPDCVAIVITGYATIERAVEAMKWGAYDFLPKPFSPNQLRLIVARGLERRRLVRETVKLRREKEIMRNNFISMVSHELRSPLNAVQQNLMVITGGLPEIKGGAQALQMLFTNLIHNGIKYNRKGGAVGVELGTEGPNVKVRVSDTGVGIPAEKIPLIFEQFYRIKVVGIPFF
jgi:FixJ family two-component response regulator